jgi:hypothetical protein
MENYLGQHLRLRQLKAPVEKSGLRLKVKKRNGSCGNCSFLRRVYYPRIVFLKVLQMHWVIGVTFRRRIWKAAHVEER